MFKILEHLLYVCFQLSACGLQESSRNGGYTESGDTEFINSLERYAPFLFMYYPLPKAEGSWFGIVHLSFRPSVAITL